MWSIPGPNGRFDGIPPTGDDVVTHFDVAVFGLRDAEGLGFNPDANDLIVLDRKGPLLEVTQSGTLVRSVPITFLNPVTPADVAVAPSSQNPSINNWYIVDRNVDNAVDPNENDGLIYEITFGSTSSGNLLQNPGFELDANTDNKPDSWTSNAKFTRSSDLVHGGSFSGKHFDTTNSNYTIKQTVNNLSAGHHLYLCRVGEYSSHQRRLHVETAGALAGCGGEHVAHRSRENVFRRDGRLEPGECESGGAGRHRQCAGADESEQSECDDLRR